MKSKAHNPSENVVPAGISEEGLVAAIVSSGFPLQGVVASRLLPHFAVVEEWGFIDDETKEHRSLDIHAYRQLSNEDESHRHTGLKLLIECKRSRHPFVFFQQVVARGAPDFPRVNGIPNGSIWIDELDSKRVIHASPTDVLGLDELPFVKGGPPLCAAFSKAIPSGKKVELSGTEPFSAIVLPLVKAFRHALRGVPAPDATGAIFPTITLCVAVLDAPMLLVESPEKADEPALCPWIRVVRHESVHDPHGLSRSRFYTVDVVHANYLSSFLERHLLPFSAEFATRVRNSEDVLRHGGSVVSLDNWTWDQVKARSGPKPTR